jgi:phosphate/sulfate permease
MTAHVSAKHFQFQDFMLSCVRAGITAIVSSWVISPFMALIVVAVVFGLIRTFVLRSEHSFKRAFYVRRRLQSTSSLSDVHIIIAVHTCRMPPG